MNFRTSRVTADRAPAAYEVLRQAADWLARQGRRQRIANTSWQTYQQWQIAGVNYGVYAEDAIAAIFSLPVEQFVDWPEFADRGPAVWLRALATHPDFRGQQVGKFAVNSALAIAGQGVAVYLDCVSDFLPDYYLELGFEIVSRQTRQYPCDGVYDITLMRHGNRLPPSTH